MDGETHILSFKWKYDGQAPLEVVREVRPDSILALPQLADDGFESVTIRRAEDLRELVKPKV